MVRVNLSVYNNSLNYVPLDFGDVGDLNQPLDAEYVNVVKLSIPNNATPIWKFPSYPLYVTLGYGSVYYQQQVAFKVFSNDPNDYGNVYELAHLVIMVNEAIQTAITQLNIMIPLPSVDPPYVIYDQINNLYSVVALTSAYDSSLPTPMSISFNTGLFNIFQTLPTTTDINNFNRIFKLLFVPTKENVYLTNYTKITQEASSLASYAYPKNVIVATSMPVEGEIFSSKSENSQQSWLNVIQNLTIDYSGGIHNVYENNDFSTVADFYRSSKVMAKGIYSVKCSLYYQTNDNNIKQFVLAPYQTATLMLEFR